MFFLFSEVNFIGNGYNIIMLIKYEAKKRQGSALGIKRDWKKIWSRDDFRLLIIVLLPSFSLAWKEVFLKLKDQMKMSMSSLMGICEERK